MLSAIADNAREGWERTHVRALPVWRVTRTQSWESYPLGIRRHENLHVAPTHASLLGIPYGYFERKRPILRGFARRKLGNLLWRRFPRRRRSATHALVVAGVASSSRGWCSGLVMDLSAVARQRFSHRSGEASLSAATSSRRTDDDEDEDDLDADEAKSLVRAFVKHALDGVRNGERAQYYELLEALDGLEAPDVAQDKLLMLTVLVECVSSLCETNHEELLRTVLGVNPWRCGEATALLVTEFCVNLVSTHTGSLLQTCLEMLVSFFTPPQGYDLALLDKDWLGDNAKERFGTSPSYASAMHGSGRSIDPHGTASLSTPGALRTAETVTAGLVTSVTTILTLVPLAASVLRTVLLRHVPHKSAHKNIQTQYLRCAFRVAETEIGKSLRDALLRGVTTHLLEVDVEITWEHIRDPGGDNGSGSDTDVEDDMDGDGEDGDRTNGFGAVDDVFELDDIEKTIEIEMTRQAAVWERDARQRAGGQFGRNKGGGNGYHRNGAASPAASSGNRETGPQSSFAVDEAADTLDGMMSAVLAHVDTRIDRGDLNGVGDCVLGIFLSTLLPAHTSKFTQFLVFHVCARDAADREPPRVGDSDESCLNLPFSSGNSFGASFGLSGRIVDALVERVTNPHHPPAGRLASAAYLASFLSRAAFLPPEFLTKALTRVTNWCVSLADSAASGSGVISVGQSVQKKSTITGGALARGFGSSFKIHESGVGEDGGSAEGPGLEIEIENGASTDGTGASGTGLSQSPRSACAIAHTFRLTLSFSSYQSLPPPAPPPWRCSTARASA